MMTAIACSFPVLMIKIWEKLEKSAQDKLAAGKHSCTSLKTNVFKKTLTGQVKGFIL